MALDAFFKAILVSSLAIIVVMTGPSLIDSENELNSHLVEFLNYNNSHHDNIDERPHTHKHKHSEDGEEHEHNHDHSKVTQSEVKLLSRTVKVFGKVTVVELKLGFLEKVLLSNPHPSKIYRPPMHS